MQKKITSHTTGSKTIIQNKWVHIMEDTFRLSNGFNGTYLVVDRSPGVMILPITREKDIVYTYLVKQFRYPIGKEVFQFPMGSVDEDNDPQEQAQKELQEETGLIAKDLTLFTTYYVDPGLSRQICYVYIADGILKKGQQHLEATEEGMEVKKVTISELQEMIDAGHITDAWVYAGAYMLLQYLQKLQRG